MAKHELLPEEKFCLEGCGTYEQYFQMRKGFEEDSCIFCDLDRELNHVLFEDKHVYAWLVPRAYMRKELAYHALFVPKRHIRMEMDLTSAEVLSIHHAKRLLHREHGYRGGITHVREGDMGLNAGTVPHLHYNTFMPNGTGEVRIPVFKDQKDREANRVRAEGFARRYASKKSSKR